MKRATITEAENGFTLRLMEDDENDPDSYCTKNFVFNNTAQLNAKIEEFFLGGVPLNEWLRDERLSHNLGEEQ